MLKLFSAICLVLAALWPQAALAQGGTYAPNTVLAGPPSGSSRGFPLPRALVGLDLPTPTASTLGGVNSFTCASHQWVSSLSIAGAFACTQPATSDLSGASALTAANDTNVTLTLGGTPATALLAGASITAGWTGTLAAGRLNANVVQGVTNDINVTGSIAAQNLTLGWTGTLAVGRGGTGLSSIPAFGVMLGNNTSPVNLAFPITAGNLFIDQGAAANPAFKPLSQDCTITNLGVITCTKTNNVAFGPLATQATPCTVSQGCTGDTTLTAHGALIGEGTSAIAATTAGAANSLLMCGGGVSCAATDPTFVAVATTAQWENDTANLPLSTDQLWGAGSFTTITFGATTTIDLSTLINGTITLTGNITTLNWNNCKAGQTGVIEFIQDATGSRTVPAAWNGSFRWAGGARGVLSTAGNAVDWLFYQCKSSTVAFVSLQKALAN